MGFVKNNQLIVNKYKGLTQSLSICLIPLCNEPNLIISVLYTRNLKANFAFGICFRMRARARYIGGTLSRFGLQTRTTDQIRSLLFAVTVTTSSRYVDVRVGKGVLVGATCGCLLESFWPLQRRWILLLCCLHRK